MSLLVIVEKNSNEEALQKTVLSLNSLKEKHQEKFSFAIVEEGDESIESQKNKIIQSSDKDFVIFLLAGNTLEKNTLDSFDEKNADIILFDWAKLKNDNSRDYVSSSFSNKDFLLGEECDELLIPSAYSIYNFAFNIQSLLTKNILFTENKVYSDDVFFIQAVNHSERINILKEVFLVSDINISKETRVSKVSSLQLDYLLQAIHDVHKTFNPRKKILMYRINQRFAKEMMNLVSSKSDTFIKRAIVEKTLLAINEYGTSYYVPLKVKATNFFLFRKRYLQNNKIDEIIKIVEQRDSGKLDKRMNRILRSRKMMQENKVFNFFYQKKLGYLKSKVLKNYIAAPISEGHFLLMGNTDEIQNLYLFLKENGIDVKTTARKFEGLAELDKVKNGSIDFLKRFYLSEVIVVDGVKLPDISLKKKQKVVTYNKPIEAPVVVAKVNRVNPAIKKYYKKKKNQKKDEHLVIFESFGGKQASDSPRAIYDYLKEHHPEYDLVWVCKEENKESFEGIPHVVKFTKEWVDTISKAKFWISNARNPAWLSKPKETIYIQSWHGTPLKKLALDMDEVSMPGTNTSKYKANFKKEANNWDYLIAPNKYSKEIFKRAFGYNGLILESGYPRNDYLINNKDNHSLKDQFKETLNLPKDKKVILYAPTWRDDEFYDVGKYKFEIKMDIARMKEKYGKDYILVLRMHYLIADNLDVSEFGDFVVDCSKHSDIKDLYMVADVLITDYSSVFFDYSLLGKPIIFFTYDLKKYEGQLRGFYFDFKKLAPGDICETNDELLSSLDKVVAGNYSLSDEKRAFISQFSDWEHGDATKKVVDLMLEEKLENYVK